MHDRSLQTTQSIELGELKVSYVADGSVDLPGLSWLPGTTEEFWAEHPEYLDGSGNLVANIGGLLVEYGERALLIDAGFGPQTVPAKPGNANGEIRGGAFLSSLAALGRAPEEIEAVAITHLHIDHIGWLWQTAPGSDRLPFAGVEILIAEPEWSQRDGLAMSVFYGATALGSPVAKRLTARLPIPAVLATAAALASITMLLASRAPNVYDAEQQVRLPLDRRQRAEQ